MDVETLPLVTPPLFPGRAIGCPVCGAVCGAVYAAVYGAVVANAAVAAVDVGDAGWSTNDFCCVFNCLY